MIPPGLVVPSSLSHTVIADASASDTHQWLPWNDRSTLLCTNAFICDPSNSRALLGFKKRGFGSSLFNGFGGKVDVHKGETIEEAALRELREEAGIEADLTRVGILLFIVGEGGEVPAFEVHIFAAKAWRGEPSEYVWSYIPAVAINTDNSNSRTDEMRPEWHPLDAIPYDKMWADDPFWLPLLYRLPNSTPFIGRADFAAPDESKGEKYAGKMLKWWFAELDDDVYSAEATARPGVKAPTQG